MYIDLAVVKEKELVPGFHGKFLHTEHMTIVHWRIEKGATLPLHAHPQEQVVNLIEGEFEMIVDGEPKVLHPGDVVLIAGDVEHSGIAKTECRIIDVFSPVREEYRFD